MGSYLLISPTMMSKVFFLLSCLMLVCSPVKCAVNRVRIPSSLGTDALYSVTIVTGEGSDCGSNSDVFVHIDGTNHEHCQTNSLDNPGNDFTPGSTGVYYGDLLGACLTTDFPNGVYQYVVHHDGSDGWCMEEVNLEFRNGVILTCDPDNIFLDDDETYTCDAFKKKSA